MTQPAQAMMLPKSSWRTVLPLLKRLGENATLQGSDHIEDYPFWQMVGLFSDEISTELTPHGRAIFESVFIHCDGSEKAALKKLLLQLPMVLSLQQYLWGFGDVSIERAATVLKATRFLHPDSRESLTYLFDLLNYAEIITYNKKNRTLKVQISPDTAITPRSIFINPENPFSNIIWIKRILSECRGGIYWFDKHFQYEALEWLWAVGDVSKISEIRILSLDLGEQNLSRSVRKDYNRFKREMAGKGITVAWATISSSDVRDSHDRWIIDGVNVAWNIPNVNAISSGQRSELSASSNYNDVRQAFDEHWSKSQEIT